MSDPILVAGIGLLFGLTAAAAFLFGDLHGEVRVLRRVLTGLRERGETAQSFSKENR